MRSFCSVKTSSRTIRQLSGPKLVNNCRKDAPLKSHWIQNKLTNHDYVCTLDADTSKINIISLVPLRKWRIVGM